MSYLSLVKTQYFRLDLQLARRQPSGLRNFYKSTLQLLLHFSSTTLAVSKTVISLRFYLFFTGSVLNFFASSVHFLFFLPAFLHGCHMQYHTNYEHVVCVCMEDEGLYLYNTCVGKKFFIVKSHFLRYFKIYCNFFLYSMCQSTSDVHL